MASKQEQLAAVVKENAELAAAVSRQTVNKADVDRMVAERTKLKEILEAVGGQREGLQRRLVEEELGVEHQLEALEATVQAYNTRADRLQLIPATAKRADGVTYEIHVNRGAPCASDVISVDLKAVVRPGLGRLCELYRCKARELAADALRLQEQLDAGREAISERAEDNLSLEAQVRKLDAQFRQVKEVVEAGVRQTASQAERVKEEVAALRNAVSANLADSEERVRGAQSEYEALCKACEGEVQRLQVELNEGLEAILNHKLLLRKLLDFTLTEMKAVASGVAAVRVPACPAAV